MSEQVRLWRNNNDRLVRVSYPESLDTDAPPGEYEEIGALDLAALNRLCELLSQIEKFFAVPVNREQVTGSTAELFTHLRTLAAKRDEPAAAPQPASEPPRTVRAEQYQLALEAILKTPEGYKLISESSDDDIAAVYVESGGDDIRVLPLRERLECFECGRTIHPGEGAQCGECGANKLAAAEQQVVNQKLLIERAKDNHDDARNKNDRLANRIEAMKRETAELKSDHAGYVKAKEKELDNYVRDKSFVGGEEITRLKADLTTAQQQLAAMREAIEKLPDPATDKGMPTEFSENDTFPVHAKKLIACHAALAATAKEGDRP